MTGSWTLLTQSKQSKLQELRNQASANILQRSLNYGKHWTAAQVNKAFAPTAKTVQTVRDWLMSTGIEAERITVSDNKGWLAFDAAVEEVERLFQTQYFEHGHADADKYTIGCDS